MDGWMDENPNMKDRIIDGVKIYETSLEMDWSFGA